ncbi:Protein of unknown function, partial [Cotesia congregata]
LCDIEQCVGTLNNEIAVISKWSRYNGLKLNAGKTKAMIFGTAQKDLRWLSLKSRREFFLSCLIYKAFYLHQKPLIQQNLRALEPRFRRGDVRQDYLALPSCRTTKYDKSIIVSVIRVWNGLPVQCTSALTFVEFRRLTYEYFLSVDRS